MVCFVLSDAIFVTTCIRLLLCLRAGGSGVGLHVCPNVGLFVLVGLGRGFLTVAWPAGWCFSFAPGFSGLFGARGSPSSGGLLGLLSPRIWFVRVVVMICLLVIGGSLTIWGFTTGAERLA